MGNRGSCRGDNVGDTHLKMLGHWLWQIGTVPRQLTRITVTLSLFFAAVSTERAQAQLCIQLNNTTYTQNFNTLAVSGANNNSSSLPIGFAFSEAGSGNITYEASDGSNATGNTYSFGTGANTDRALGEVTTGTVQSTVGACFVNNTGSAIMTFTVGYTGEQWRQGTTGGTPDRLDFQFSTNATSLNDGTWSDENDLDFTTPNATGAAGALNGNSAGNRTVFAPEAMTPANIIAADKTFFIRWLPLNIAGANDGLAIDDFLLGFIPPPGLSGDFNSNNEVDAADYVIWRDKFGPGTLSNDAGISPGIVDTADYSHWRKRFGIATIPFAASGNSSASASANVPEPTNGIFLLATGCMMVLITRRGQILAGR
jgi:hypothetical protein